MATLIDERVEDEPLPDGTELGSFEEEETIEPVAEEEEHSVPDKYVGKSAVELIAMHQEAERFNGKQSAEVGELRRNVDQLIQAQLAPAAAPAADKEEPIDFFEDPEKAMDARIQNHPDIVAARAEAAAMKKQTASQALNAKHPDMGAVIADEGFATWVGESNIRRKLFQAAHHDYDYEAADELLSNWKERQGIIAKTASVEKKERKQAVKDANTGNTAASAAGRTKKMYRRADIIRLMNDDPDRYLSLSDEIMKAYAEGRVIK